MTTVVPQWPYLVQIDGTIGLEAPGALPNEAEMGDWCGEWGGYIDERGKPAGVRLMFFLGNAPQDSSFFRAVNAREDNGDYVVLFKDSRLADADGCPFLPVYRATRPDGREILQLSGYE